MNIRQRFRQSLKCGTGEAYFILQAKRKIDFSKDIERAALTNYAYDPQCEGDRACYIARLIELSGKKEHLIDIVIKALEKERENCWNLDQLFALAKIFAKQGNVKAKRAIYKRFYKKTIKYFECLGQEQILELDGIEGLKHIAEVRGKALIKNPDDWEDSSLVDHFQKENPNIKVYDELKRATTNNPFIKKYLDTIAEHKCSISKRRNRPRYSYKIIRKNIDSKMKLPFLPSATSELTKADIKRLADDLLQEKDPERLEKYLMLFWEIKFPYDYQPILKIAKGKNNRDNRLVELACESLKFFNARDIRTFAIEKLSKTNIPSDYLPLLVSNYKRGDHKILARIADKYNNENVIHDCVRAYVDIYKANKTKQCKEPLEIIYSKLTCGLHRYDIIKILHENGVLSKKLLKEIEFDSYEEIRDFYKKHYKH